VRSRIRACIHSSEGDDDGRLCRVYHRVRSPWYMTQCAVYGHEYRYISKIRVTKPSVCDPVRRIRSRISLCIRARISLCVRTRKSGFRV
jgi:hypothetical protein